jgi:hypothetical protein
MKWIRLIFITHWRYKLSALLISGILWGVVNFGSRTAVTLSRYVEVRGGSTPFVYRVEPERVDLTVYVVERLLLSKFLTDVRVFVDVSELEKEGTYTLKVLFDSPFPVLIHPTGAEPPVVKVMVSRRKTNYRNRKSR